MVPSKLSYLAVGWCLLSATWLVQTGCGEGDGEDARAAGHPTLQLDPDNSRYLLFRGEPTALVGSSEHYGAVINADFDFEAYLDELRSDGLNVTRTFSGSYFELPDSLAGIGADSTLAPSPQALTLPWRRDARGRWDLSAWNSDYFERLRDFVAAAGERDIVVELTLFSAIYDQARWEVNPFNPANNVQGAGTARVGRIYTLDNGGALAFQEDLVRKLVTELNEFDNVYFEVINEPWMPPAPADDDWQERIAATIEEAEAELPNRHLIARNYNQNDPPPAQPDPSIAVHNFHYRPDLEPFFGSLDGALAFDETGLQGTDPAPYRAEAWFFMLNGGAVYNNLDFSFAPGHEDGSYAIPASAPAGGGAALRRQLGVLADFLGRFDLAEMEPRSGLVAARPEGADVRLLGGPDSYGLYISGAPGPIGLTLPGGDYSVAWLDPVSGRELGAEKLNHAGGELRLAPPEYDFDIAAHIEREGL